MKPLAQAAQSSSAVLSTRHSKVESFSFDSKSKLGVVEFVRPPSTTVLEPRMLAVGGESTEKLTVAPVVSVLPAGSVACTLKV